MAGLVPATHALGGSRLTRVRRCPWVTGIPRCALQPVMTFGKCVPRERSPDMPKPKFTGGCQCGAVRYAAEGEPLYAGYCFCEDCRRSSGSGFAPFMGFAAAA